MRAFSPLPPATTALGLPAVRPLGAFDPWQAMNAAWDVWSGTHADAAGIARRARWRLGELLAAARAAPLHERRLRDAAGATGVGTLSASRVAALPLDAIRPIGRAEMMARFDECCIDRAVTRDRVDRFLAEPQRLGEAFLGRYAVWTSSGTTGTPGIYVHDARALAVYDALESMRLCGLDRPGHGAQALGELWHLPFGQTHRYAMVGATGGHFAGNASIERLRRNMPWAASRIRVVSIMQPLARLLAELEDAAPTVIATYPTVAALLAEEHAAGRLRLRPRELWLGGEQLSAAVRAQIEASFGCRVREGYGASECLSIAWNCEHGALHVNSDWVVLEPVDREFRPVPPELPSHTVLLTNLANHVQPMIRYDLGDSVTLSAAPCACGAPFPVIRIEGRRDDVLEFDGRAGPVKLLPLALVTVMEDEAGAFDFQLLGRGRRALVLRLEPVGSAAEQHARRAACHHALRAHLDLNGLDGVTLIDDPCPPVRDALSGKLRRVMHAH